MTHTERTIMQELLDLVQEFQVRTQEDLAAATAAHDGTRAEVADAMLGRIEVAVSATAEAMSAGVGDE